MKKNIRNLSYIFILFFFAVMFCGCSASRSINIKHDVPDVAKKFTKDNTSKAVVKKSSGVIIYKDNSTTNTTGGNIHFGPNDLNFDVQIKMR